MTITAARRKKTVKVHRPRAEGGRQANGRNLLRLALAVYGCVIVFSLWHWLSQPVRNWDMMGYIGVIASFDTKDPVEIHDRMLAAIKPVVWPELYAEYAEKNRLSADAGNFYRQLPFYRIKPLYVGAVWLFNKLGAGLAQATWLVSAVSFAAIAALLALWRPEQAHRGGWLLGISALVYLGYLPLGCFAGYSVPDPLSLAFFLAGILGWMRWRSLPLYAAGSLLCILARPDALIQVAFMTAYFVLFAGRNQRLSPLSAGITMAACLAGYLGIRLTLDAGGWTMLFYRGFIDDNFDFTKNEAHVSITQYVSAVWAGICRQFLNPRFDILLAFSAAALAAAWHTRKEAAQHWVWMMLFTWAAYGARFMLFPASDDRYFYCFYIFMIMAGIEMLTPFTRSLLDRGHPLTEAFNWLVRRW